MGLTIAEKIIKEHLVSGEMKCGEEIGLRIDQTLTQDATGTMAYLEFETMEIPSVRTDLSIAYIDHNTLQSGFENADDHRFIQSAAAKYGLYFSRPGNGICHQVHLERFAVPGKTLIGSDSHTPTCGGMGMLAMGAGGMDVAVAMGGGAYHITMPKMYKVNLTGKLRPFVSAKDISLEILRILTVKGGVGAIIEWGGEGIKTLSVPERATITNMGAELGATTSIFPSDEVTREFLKAQGREDVFRPLKSDEDARYDKLIDIDLSKLEPLIACPHSPDNIKKVSELAGTEVNQVCVGSCTNSSLFDMLKIASILSGKTVDSKVSMSVSPGSKQVLMQLSESGALTDILASGARLLECACGPCIGMGFSPNSSGISLRTFNRNFEGRSGTADAKVFLVSPETAAISAIKGVITNPMDMADDTNLYKAYVNVVVPDEFKVDDSSIIAPLEEEKRLDFEILRGPNIKPLPVSKSLSDEIEAELVIKLGNNITTDHIMPAGSKILPYRSNIPYLSKFCFETCDKQFPERAIKAGEGIILGGENYGQGSSREHAALVPLYLGIRAVIAKSFARIHMANLINVGILPLTLENREDYNEIEQGDKLVLKGIMNGLKSGCFSLINERTGKEYTLSGDFTERQKDILLAGGLLKYIARR